MSVMGFQKKLSRGWVGGLSSIQFFMKEYLTYYSQGKFSNKKLSDDIRHLSSVLFLDWNFYLLCKAPKCVCNL